MTSISRPHYADLYGPTTGDLVRLGDTELFAEIEHDFVSYGDELTTGAGKVKLAYALQILGLSVTATATENDHIRAAASLLDDLIVPALDNYRKHATRN